jgi:archaeosine synthase
LGDAPIAAVANALEYLRNARRFAERIASLRPTFGYRRLAYAPGLAAPHTLALLVYAGFDLVDDAHAQLAATDGVLLTADGPFREDEAAEAMCDCVSCVEGDRLGHNRRALWQEMRRVRNAIRLGRLRELVERRVVADPWATQVLRHLDLRHYETLERHVPVFGGGVRAYTPFSLARADVVRFRRRVRERYRKPPSARVLLLLPCSARKPYSASKSHRRFREAILAAGNPNAVHEVVVTSPLGVVPRELEAFPPARDYDIPVTGDWSRDEVAVVQEDLAAFVAANPYDAVVVHLGAEAPFVRDVVPDAILTTVDRPASPQSLGSLRKALAEVLEGTEPVAGRARVAEFMANVARFQFGPPGEALVEAATFVGRYPTMKFLRNGVQVAMFTDKGRIALTLAGGKVLSERDAYWVEIDDFYPKGNVFAVGVLDAAPEIRVGDDVVVRRDGEVRAVGVASMPAAEMIESDRGEAVHVRHAAKPDGA